MAEPRAGGGEPLTRVMALHALAYCERLFYLEEVEEIRVADERVLAGREAHELRLGDPDATEIRNFELESSALGLYGRVDAARRREGGWVAYEHKRGQCARGRDGQAQAWPADRIQVGAYALLLEEALGEPVAEGRVRYHGSGVTVRVPVDEGLRAEVRAALRRAAELRSSTQRPPVTDNPRRCLHCSLAPVCLPEEARLAEQPDRPVLRLFPATPEGAVVHVTEPEAQVQRRGDSLVIRLPEQEPRRLPIREVAGLVIHGHAQLTTQALHLCCAEGVPIHWITGGGRHLGCLANGGLGVQRKLRQYGALSDPGFCLHLARRLAAHKIESQLRFLLRATRGSAADRAQVQEPVERIREALRQVDRIDDPERLRGLEGAAGRAYFEALPHLLHASVDPRLRPDGRSRRPPRDRFNAALSFLYALLYRSVLQAVLVVGLEPALGFFHRPRSASPPLVLDLMELFRVPLCDLPLVASLNRGQWRPDLHFSVTRDQAWLSPEGRRLAIDLYERRLAESWKHPVLGYSLSYVRAIELEVRLLEKEWSGEAGLFARSRLR
ncbi:MAG TPA: type I-MYXAN CRISPR-associated endonuclease Cas1 [Candidatus Dormibacteraeota bacterium]|nr:type I-MYXAN CRISPR-associated endonuclease Cas1 [Candidatus Dormibacteraeota bacterium]